MPDTERLIHLEQQIIIVDQKISRVSEDVRAASEEARQNGEKMSRILSLLVGNVLDKNDGGVLGRIEANRQKIDLLEKRIDAIEAKLILRITPLEEKWKRVGWVMFGFAIGGGVGGFSLAKIIELLTKK